MRGRRINPGGYPVMGPPGPSGEGGTGAPLTASNLGTGAGIFAGRVVNDFQFKSLVAGSNVSITPSGDSLVIAATGSGGGTGVTGPLLFLDNAITANQIVPTGKNALAIAPTISPGVTVTVPSGSKLVILDDLIGQANTLSSVGAGVSLAAGKVGVDLRVKSLVAGTNVSLDSDGTTVTINATGGGGGTNLFGPTTSYVQLPTSIGSGSNSGIPTRLETTVAIQAGTAASPLTLNRERAISSQAVVNASFPWTSPSHWSPNEFSVINQGNGRVNALNAVLVTSTDLNMDNTAMYNYSKTSYTGSVAGAGGIVGYWSIVDTRGSRKRGVGAEFVMLHNSVDRYDYEPRGGLSEDAENTTFGAFHVGVRISTLLSNKIIARGLDIITGDALAGFDTGIAVHAFRSRALFIHNNLDASKGGARVGVEFSESVPTYLKFANSGGTPLTLEQNFSGTFGQYYTFRKDSTATWASFYSNGLVTLSNSASTGAVLQVQPTGAIYAGHQVPTQSGFHVQTGGCFWLNTEKTSYLTQVGSTIVLMKNGSAVATW